MSTSYKTSQKLIRFMDPRTINADSNWQRVQQPQDWEELEDDMPYQDLALSSAVQPEAKRAALPSRWTYDVFLSYKGDYESSSFVSHLYKSLCKSGIRAFVNDELVKTSGEALKAIQESRTAIIVISKSYASSTSCLNNLATILECCKMECRFICPIFYDVEPSELQHQTGTYGEVFAKLEKRFEHNKHHLQKWRVALSEAANSRGSFYLNPNKDVDFYIIGKIMEEVSTRIYRFPFPVEEVLARKSQRGLESGVQEVMSFMDVGSNKEVKMVGICGIRKSIVARAVCNSIARLFEDLWYFSGFPLDILPWDQDDLSYPIKKKFPVSEITRGYGLTLDDFYNLIMQSSFPKKKMLVVLDDVEELDQLGELRECDRFDEGSRIIVATWDEQLLESLGIEKIYDANELSDEEALNLLCYIVYKKDELSNRAIRDPGEIPLLFKEMVRYLGCRRVDEWHSVLDKMEAEAKKRCLRASRENLTGAQKMALSMPLDGNRAAYHLLSSRFGFDTKHYLASTVYNKRVKYFWNN